MESIINYLTAQLDKMTAWIGLIGLVLTFLGFHGALTTLFLLLIVLPESQFSEMFKKWTKGIRDAEQKHRQ